jgi:glycosyltransferase involved in cell wall biosynthesis
MIEQAGRKKVLILYNNMFHYRVAIFKLLAEQCDLTVCYSIGPATTEPVNFRILKLPIFKYNRLVIHKDNILEMCQQYDVVIAYGDIAWIKLSTLPFRKNRRFKVIFWSIGVSASYEKKYDAVSYWNSARDFFYRRADALLFYSDYPISNYVKRGFNPEKIFVAPNTVAVYNGSGDAGISKDSLLFIGTLYMQKGILSLLENYKLALESNSNILPLNIIGGGEEFEKVNSWIVENRLSSRIFLRGPIFDPAIKAGYFKKALACISPVQAGLSVLESMGYGVPFITMHDALTGGERFNITDHENGRLMRQLSDLQEIIVDISENRQKYVEMGKNAFNYYQQKRKPSDMANGILKAIAYVLEPTGSPKTAAL